MGKMIVLTEAMRFMMTANIKQKIPHASGNLAFQMSF
jgi:hypothetical protein